ncbi:hypothetical protein ACNPQM_33605 [Streptomyces sp. NPDC056231]|uniref:hypothetical protein n=1 Tax=Streptomyces sp. NPDC056231 TaxID=3345755 RepID=UPI003AABF307
MQRTSITVKLLVGVAVTAVTGCVSVEPRPGIAPRSETSRPIQDLAPQVVGPPVRDTLEAIPDPKPSPKASGRPAKVRSDTQNTAPRAPQQREHVGVPRARHAPPTNARVPNPPAVPATGTSVCALGRAYGGWSAGSPEARICEDTYGR